MKILVTGATGYLGSRVVRLLLDHGHSVRAVVRSASTLHPDDWRNRAEIIHADLLTFPNLESLFDGIDVLVHLAATFRNPSESQRTETVISTERLIKALQRTGSPRHLVLAGSCSIYDWSAVRKTLTEESPLEKNFSDRDGYAAAKASQERIVRQYAEDNQWTLSVLRPGFIYGPGANLVSGAGIKLRRLFLVFAPLAHLRLTHVENCANAFVNAAEKRIAGTFNIIDDEQISAWRYAGHWMNQTGGGLRIPIPYFLGLTTAFLAKAAICIVFSVKKGKCREY